MFQISNQPISPTALRAGLEDPRAGAFVAFEGWVRNHHDGHEVRGLEYEAFGPLAEKEGNRIVEEAIAKFSLRAATCVHRVGALNIGEMAVWVGVSADHRGSAFDACRYVIDEAKARVPIWKKEHYLNGPPLWVNCATRGGYVDVPTPDLGN